MEAVTVDNVVVSDTDALVGICDCFIARVRMTGAIISGRNAVSADELSLMRDIRTLVNRIGEHMASLDCRALAEVLPRYDFLYRIVYNREPDPKLLDRCFTRLIDARFNGDLSVTPGVIAGIMQQSVHQNACCIDERSLRYYLYLIQSWCEQLGTSGCFENVSDEECYERLAVLFNEDLSAEYAAAATEMKRVWFKANLREDVASMTTSALKAYRKFLFSGWSGAVSYRYFRSIEDKVLHELMERNDYHALEREAIRITVDSGRIERV